LQCRSTSRRRRGRVFARAPRRKELTNSID
jgi:hypothetical protein